MTVKDALKDRMLKTINTLHKTAIAVSGGQLGKTAGNMQVVKLTTTGRTSGLPRTVMLTTPIHEDGRYVLVASKGGDDRHPDWYRNLVANPEITLEPVGASGPLALIARTATSEEKAALWPAIEAANDGYAGYKDKTTRDIPVVVCEAAS